MNQYAHQFLAMTLQKEKVRYGFEVIDRNNIVILYCEMWAMMRFWELRLSRKKNRELDKSLKGKDPQELTQHKVANDDQQENHQVERRYGCGVQPTCSPNRDELSEHRNMLFTEEHGPPSKFPRAKLPAAVVVGFNHLSSHLKSLRSQIGVAVAAECRFKLRFATR